MPTSISIKMALRYFIGCIMPMQQEYNDGFLLHESAHRLIFNLSVVHCDLRVKDNLTFMLLNDAGDFDAIDLDAS